MSSSVDAAVACVLAALLILGGYQVYFLPQRWPFRAPHSLLSKLDDKIPFRPRWVWVYSLLYYPFILSTILTLRDFREYAYTALNFFILLCAHVLAAYILPVATPPNWRQYDDDGSASVRFLRFVQTMDKGRNCFPSMHVAVATLAALHITSNARDHVTIVAIGSIVLLLAISVSALFTKQHYIVDIPAGAALGLAVYATHPLLYH